MKYCNKCGAQLSDECLFCTQCGNPQQQSTSPEDDFISTAKKAATLGVDIVKEKIEKSKKEIAENHIAQEKAYDAYNECLRSSSLVYAEGEISIRTYEVTKAGGVKGNLLITNKRVIFLSSSSSSKVFMSTPIDSVGAIDIIAGDNQALELLAFILCLPIITIPLAIVLFKRAKSITLCISAANSSPAMVIGGIANTGKAVASISGKPGHDIHKVMAELGAMILDLQQFGDNAIEKWKKEEA